MRSSLFALSLAACQAAPPASPSTDLDDGGVVMVRLHPVDGLGAARTAVDARPLVPLVDLEAPRWEGTAQAARTLEALGVAAFHESLVHDHPGFVPSDARYRDQWALKDIDASKARDSARSAHGVVVAVVDNARGIAGVAPGPFIMPVCTMAGRGGRSEWIADGLLDAVRNGAKVINPSLGGAYCRVIDEAVARAWRAGVVVVAAAGNDGAPQASVPASSLIPGVIGVAATDDLGQLAPFSNDGPGVDLTAPGVDILSTFGAREYRTMSATSMAAPHVSGALALRIGGRGKQGLGEVAAVLESLPGGLTDDPRLDLPSLVADAPADGHRLSTRRTRLTFHAASSRKRPPPQSVSLESPAPVAFDVETESWVHVGKCREAPCRLSVSVEPSALGFGAHEASLVLHPHDGSSDLALTITLLVGVGVDDASFIEADLGGRGRPAAESMSHPAGAPVTLPLVRGGHPASAHWFVDDALFPGNELRGVFRPEPHGVEAVDDLGARVATRIDVRKG